MQPLCFPATNTGRIYYYTFFRQLLTQEHVSFFGLTESFASSEVVLEFMLVIKNMQWTI